MKKKTMLIYILIVVAILLVFAAFHSSKGASLGLAGVDNARQLGGYVMEDGRTVKEGLLLRTANLSEATEEDVQKLENLDLKLVIDLRTASEKEKAPDVVIPGVEYCWFNVAENPSAVLEENLKKENFSASGSSTDKLIARAKSESMQVYMKNLCTYILTDPDSQADFAAAFQKILDQKGGTVLWHCTSGKDRCGTMSVLMLSALGADRETIMSDFELSNSYYEQKIFMSKLIGRFKGLNDTELETVQALVGVVPEDMENALAAVDEQYGSMDNYLHEALGLTDSDIQNLRDWYTE